MIPTGHILNLILQILSLSFTSPFLSNLHYFTWMIKNLFLCSNQASTQVHIIQLLIAPSTVEYQDLLHPQWALFPLAAEHQGK